MKNRAVQFTLSDLKGENVEIKHNYQFSWCKDCKYLQGCYYQNEEFSRWPYFIKKDCLKQGEINNKKCNSCGLYRTDNEVEPIGCLGSGSDKICDLYNERRNNKWQK